MKEQAEEQKQAYSQVVSQSEEMKSQFEGDIRQYMYDIDRQKEINKTLEGKIGEQTSLMLELHQQIQEGKEESKRQQEEIEEKEEEVQALEANLKKTQKQLEEYIEQLASQKEMIAALTDKHTLEKQPSPTPVEPVASPQPTSEPTSELPPPPPPPPPVGASTIDPSSLSVEMPADFKTSKPNSDRLLKRIPSSLHSFHRCRK